MPVHHILKRKKIFIIFLISLILLGLGKLVDFYLFPPLEPEEWVHEKLAQQSLDGIWNLQFLAEHPEIAG